MKLYKSFSKDGSEVVIKEQDIAAITSGIKQNMVNLPEKKNVLNWLKDHNNDLSKKELTDIDAILDELRSTSHVKGNSSSFYSSGINVSKFVL